MSEKRIHSIMGFIVAIGGSVERGPRGDIVVDLPDVVTHDALLRAARMAASDLDHSLRRREYHLQNICIGGPLHGQYRPRKGGFRGPPFHYVHRVDRGLWAVYCVDRKRVNPTFIGYASSEAKAKRGELKAGTPVLRVLPSQTETA